METLSRHVLVVLVALALVLVSGCTGSTPDGPATVGRATATTSGSGPEHRAGGGRAGDDEVTEEAELTDERLDAFEAARGSGDVGAGLPIDNGPATGWHGERLLNPRTDDWEPAIAADPKAPYVYMLTTRYGEPKTCPQHCPTPFLPLTISKDGGRTWGAQAPLCVCRGAGAQYDPTIEVVPDTGAVYSTFLNADRAGGFSAAFIKSEDHGKTWTEPVHVYGHVAWTDKPEITSSANGRHVYVSWNGPQGGDLYVGISHDFGASWSQVKLSSSKRYYFAYDATTLPSGTVVFSESSLRYAGGGAVQGSAWHHAVISRDHGDTWGNVVVDKVERGATCVAEGCSDDFYTGQTSVASDPAGNLAFAYEGAATDAGLQRVFVRTSDDQGRTWSRRVALSARRENATGPRVDFARSGHARIWYMQTSGGGDPDAWNVRFRSSSDGGASWSPSVRLSDARSGPGYVRADGFREIYGDYGEIAVTDTGKTIAVWGEGFTTSVPAAPGSPCRGRSARPRRSRPAGRGSPKGSCRPIATGRYSLKFGLPSRDGIGEGVVIVRRAAALIATTAAAMVGLVGSAVPGTAAQSSTSVPPPVPSRLGAVLVGGNEVPGPGDTDGFGLANVRVAASQVCWRISVSAVEPIAAAHIHAGPRGVAGPVVVPLEPYRQGCADVKRRLARFIAHHPNQFYVNVHNAEFPAGALRGQLLR